MRRMTVVAPVDEAIERLRRVYAGWRRDTPVAQMRRDWDQLFAVSGIASQWICAAGVDAGRVLIYFHGGGYKLGSVRSHRDLMARISAAACCRVLGVNYRLAPEHGFPAPVHDAVTVYRWLLSQGTLHTQVAFAGDSAGGGLAAAALLALRDQKLPLPAAAVLLSAWTDLTAEGESYTTRADADPVHQRPMILATARHYLGESGDARDPLASPLFGALDGLPPLLLQVGDRETGLDDSTRFAAKARAAGVPVELEIYDDMIHVFQQFPDLLVEAREAIASIGRFLTRVWAC
jgi:acetyl esterase/lipase